MEFLWTMYLITSTFEQAKAVIEAGADILGFLQKFLCFFIS